MTSDEVLDLPDNTLALLADGRVGMLIGYPFEHRAETLIQVPGETEARKVHPDRLTLDGEALLEQGAERPPAGVALGKYALTRYMLRAMSTTNQEGGG